MEALMNILSPLIQFVYSCFDRIAINGYLVLTRPENVVYFLRQVYGLACLDKAALAHPTRLYQGHIEELIRRHRLPNAWADKLECTKEEAARPHLEALVRRGRWGLYFVVRSMEQGPCFRSLKPRRESAKDPHYRKLLPQRLRYTHYYFYLRDEVLGPMLMRMGSFMPFGVTCWINGHEYVARVLEGQAVAYRRADNAFVGCADPAALQAAADSLTGELIAARLNYWCQRLGPQLTAAQRARMSQVLDRYWSITQVEYCRNFIFRANRPIRRLFERSCELGLVSMTVDRIKQVFGRRVTRRLKGRLETVLSGVDHGQHVMRAWFKNSFVKQYEKLRTFLRFEVCSNNLKDLCLKKGLAGLATVRQSMGAILDRYAAAQAAQLDVQLDQPLLEDLAKPLKTGRTAVAGIKLHEERMARLMEVLLHGGLSSFAWRGRQVWQAVLERHGLSEADYTLTQFRYDLRKLRVHAMIARVEGSQRYVVSAQGARVMTLLTMLRRRVIGPLGGCVVEAHGRATISSVSKLEKAYGKVAKGLDEVIKLLAA